MYDVNSRRSRPESKGPCSAVHGEGTQALPIISQTLDARSHSDALLHDCRLATRAKCRPSAGDPFWRGMQEGEHVIPPEHRELSV